jgi:hypothetical protein
MANPNCLAGCISNFLCGTLDMPGPAGKQAESFAPWCWVKFSEGGNEITVGNESFKSDPNTAIVKSLEVGWENTPSIKVEIVDEAGGTLGVVADSLRKCVKRAGKGTLMTFQWGWITTRCESKSPELIRSPIFKSMINQFEVNYSEGKIKYIVEAVAYDKLTELMREDVIKGDDEYPVNIEEAIESLCAQEPSIMVRYVELQPDGKLKDVKFEWARTKDPPKAVWQTDNLNRLSTIMKWLGPFRVKDGKCDKGIIPFFSPDKPDELVLLKDPQAGPGEAQGCENSLGTFIVNGGKCSTVIEFTPTMNIVNAINTMNVGGDTSGPNKSTNQFAEDKRCDNQKKQGVEAGTQMQATITQQAFDSYGVKVANDENLKSEIAHNKANLVTSIANPGVEADLRILGNPDVRFCQFHNGTPISIVVINPFHIRGAKCGDWLAYPGCNELFTNRLWRVKAINHSINVGSYTTTLKVYLVGQSIQVSASDPLGGPGSGGPVLENACN